MATTTTTVTQQQLNDGKPKDHHRNTAKARYIGPPPIDVDGKTIPHSKRWGFSTNAFDNGELKSTAFVIAMMTGLTAFNQTQIAHQFFDYLDTNFTSFQINFFGTYLITFTWYWFIAGLFAFIDLTGKPRFLFKYKVQPFQRVDGKEYLHIAKIALRNFTVVVIPLVYLRSTLTPAKVSSKYVEGPWETMFNLFFNLICTEIGFYFIHRFFHSSFMYKRFHKQHHYMTAPVALASTYCTMTEHVFSNLLPNAIGTAIMKPHWSVQIYTFIILSTTTLCAHSGFNIPFLYSSLQHDFHHFAFNENFGPSGLIDGLLGTNKTFKLAINDGMKRNQGSRDKAREELLSKLAAWEANQDDEKKGK